MAATGFTLFPTAIGTCGIAWGDQGVLGVQLPEANEALTRSHLLRCRPHVASLLPPEGALSRLEAARRRLRRFMQATLQPPATVQQAIDGITALLAGEPVDLSGVALDMDGLPDFHRQVYDAARRIPPGRVATYGEIAAQLGEPGSARSVGQALGRNPFALIVPCHRVLAAGGQLGGFSAPGGTQTKLRLLAIERARLHREPDLFDEAGSAPLAAPVTPSTN